MKSNIFGKKLKDLRIEKGIKQSELAIIFEVTNATISRWEKGLIEPGYDMLVLIAKYFKVSADYLLGIE